jgi:MYXO-CTERM domain-containing protein
MRCAFALGAAVALLAAAAAAAHEGNPNYRSVVESVTPALKGLTVDVLNYDDRLELTNHSGRSVTVEGYSGEPYARVLADGTVELNKRSPAYYLNDDRYAAVSVPASADARAAPQWEVVDRTARLEWHDHRMHYMSRSLPPQVEDRSKRTKVFDYAIPLRVGDEPASIRGTLFWQPGDGGGAPIGMFAGLGALALIAAGAVAVVRRRRSREPVEGAEAW